MALLARYIGYRAKRTKLSAYKAIYRHLLIDLSRASSRIEGNTYTRLDTQNLIELRQVAAGKDRRDAQMILNHKAAIELLVEQVEDIGFNPYTFFNLHALLSGNLLADPSESGRLRQCIVEAQGAVQTLAAALVPPADLDQITARNIADLRDLHEGIASRYRLRLSEYRAWQPAQQAATGILRDSKPPWVVPLDIPTRCTARTAKQALYRTL